MQRARSGAGGRARSGAGGRARTYGGWRDTWGTVTWRTAGCGRRGTRRGADGGARGVRGARRAAALKGHLACDADARQTSVSRETLASWIQMQVADDGHAALRMGAMRLRDTAWGCGHVGHDAGGASVGCGHGGSTRVSGTGSTDWHGRRAVGHDGDGATWLAAGRAGDVGVGRGGRVRAARKRGAQGAEGARGQGRGARTGRGAARRRAPRARRVLRLRARQILRLRRAARQRGDGCRGCDGFCGCGRDGSCGGAARRRAARWRRDDGAWRLPGVGAMTRWGRDAGGVGARRGGGARGCWGAEGAETRGRLRVALEARCRPRKHKRVFHVKHSGVQFSF